MTKNPHPLLHDKTDYQGYRRSDGYCSHQVGPVATRDVCVSTQDDGGVEIPRKFLHKPGELREIRMKLLSDWLQKGVHILLQYVSCGTSFPWTSPEFLFHSIEDAHERYLKEVAGKGAYVESYLMNHNWLLVPLDTDCFALQVAD